MKLKSPLLLILLATILAINLSACSSNTSSSTSGTPSASSSNYFSTMFMQLKEAIAILFDANSGEKVDVAQLQTEQTLIKSVGGTAYQVGDYVTIVIPSSVLFEPAKAVVSLDADQYIGAAADIIRQYPTHNILVTANEAGLFSKADDMTLSIKQAEAFAAGLFSHGINSNFGDRGVYYTGLGDTKYVADSRYGPGITANRRIQITLYPSKKTYLKEGQQFNIKAY